MIDTKAIRCATLQLAFSGKLTQHLSTDDTIEELLTKINSQRGIRQSDNTPYDIPDHWAWVKLGDLYSINPKVQADDDMIAAFIPMERISAGFQGEFSYEEQKWSAASKNHTRFADGDVAFAKITPCFENRKSFIAANLPNGIGGGTTELIILRQKNILPKYTYYAIVDERFIRSGVETYKGMVGQQRVKLDVLKNYMIPIPPLAEQHRIVDIIDTAFSDLDLIDNSLHHYQENLSALKKKLFNAVISGQLTKQLPEDGTADDLFQCIQQEKKSLEESGKIKKKKPLSPISDEEIPFIIPPNWKWARIGQIFTLQAGKNIAAGFIKEQRDEANIYPCYGGNGMRGYVDHYNVAGFHVLIGRQGALCGNINYADGCFYATEHAVVVYEYASTDTKWIGLTLEILNLNQYATSVAQPGLAVNKIDNVLIPLPPLAEQKRIVNTIEEIMTLCK